MTSTTYAPDSADTVETAEAVLTASAGDTFDDADLGEDTDLKDLDDDNGDSDDDEDEGADSSTATTGTARTGTTRRASTGTSRAAVRRVAQKVIAVTEATPQTRVLLGELLGVDDDPVELTVAIMAGDRSALSSIADVEHIADEDPFEAGVKAQEKGRTRMRAMHSLLRALGEDVPATLNGSDAKAAITIARAAHKLSTDVRLQLMTVVDLARRS